jgi:H+/Cl- antiporter ClcA
MKLENEKIYLASIIVGAIAGIICIAFRYTIAQVATLRPQLFNHHNSIFIHLGIFSAIYAALLLTRLLLYKFPKISGSGLPQTQALIFGRRVYNKPFIYLVVKFIGGVLSLCSGLSLGREGTSVQMGSLTGYITGNILHTKEGQKRHLIAAGAGAGVSAAFTAPLSSSILIMESLQKVTLSTTIICTLLAGTTAGVISKLITPFNIYQTIPVATPNGTIAATLPIYICMALFFALLGKLFSRMLLKGKELYARWRDKLEKEGKGRAIAKEVFFLTATTWLMGLFFTDMIGGDQTFLVKESVIQSFFTADILHNKTI